MEEVLAIVSQLARRLGDPGACETTSTAAITNRNLPRGMTTGEYWRQTARQAGHRCWR